MKVSFFLAFRENKHSNNRGGEPVRALRTGSRKDRRRRYMALVKLPGRRRAKAAGQALATGQWEKGERASESSE